jgi:hypothetical protein
MSNPKFKKLSSLGGLPQGGYPNQVHLGDIEYFVNESVWQKKILWNIFIRSPKKNTLRFANFLDPNLGVGGPIV